MLGDFPLPSIPGRQRGAGRGKEEKGTDGGDAGPSARGREGPLRKSRKADTPRMGRHFFQAS